jgi:peroxiredoxin
MLRFIRTLVIFAVSVVIVAASAVGQDIIVRLGEPAPDFPPGLFSDGGQYKIADLKGKVVVLFFFDGKNLGVRKAMPEKAKVVKAMHGKGVKFLAVGANMALPQAQAYQQAALPMPIFVDSLGLMQGRYSFQISDKLSWQTRLISAAGLVEGISMDVPTIEKVMEKSPVTFKYPPDDYDVKLRPALELLEYGQDANGLKMLAPFAKSSNKKAAEAAKKLIEERKTEAETWKSEAADLEGTEPLKAYDLYHKVAAVFPNDPMGKSAVAAAKKLATNKAIAPELAARKAFAALVQTTGTGTNRPAFIQSCKALMKKYPETPTAEKTDDLIQELGGMKGKGK